MNCLRFIHRLVSSAFCSIKQFSLRFPESWFHVYASSSSVVFPPPSPPVCFLVLHWLLLASFHPSPALSPLLLLLHLASHQCFLQGFLLFMSLFSESCCLKVLPSSVRLQPRENLGGNLVWHELNLWLWWSSNKKLSFKFPISCTNTNNLCKKTPPQSFESWIPKADKQVWKMNEWMKIISEVCVGRN